MNFVRIVIKTIVGSEVHNRQVWSFFGGFKALPKHHALKLAANSSDFEPLLFLVYMSDLPMIRLYYLKVT